MASEAVVSAPSKAVAISLFPASDFFHDLIIARASVGAAHIDLIERIIEGLPIVHFGIQTA